MAQQQSLVGVFFVHKLDCGIGGMETHQRAVQAYFFSGQSSPRVCFRYIIEQSLPFFKVREYTGGQESSVWVIDDLKKLLEVLQVSRTETLFFFFNDGWWIEYADSLRRLYPFTRMAIRLGGNEIGILPWNNGRYCYEERRLLWKRSLDRYDYIIANSDYTISLLADFALEHAIVVKIRGGVNDLLCHSLSGRKKDLERELRDTLRIKSKYILTFASRFVPFKGIIPALKQLIATDIYRDSFLILVGSGPLEDEIHSWCRMNLDGEHYAFLGERTNDDVLHILAGSSLLVNPSLSLRSFSGDGVYYHTETMGRTMMEAVSVGTKVLATDVGGVAELFRECPGAGILVHPDGPSLRKGFESIEQFISSPMSVADYGWNHVFKQYVHLFE